MTVISEHADMNTAAPDDPDTGLAGAGVPLQPKPPQDSGSAAADVPVLEGTVVRVDQPGNDAGDWLAGLADRARERRPVIHPALRSRTEALTAAKWMSSHYTHVTAYHL